MKNSVSQFYKGVDLSSLKEVIEDGGHFFENDEEKDILDILSFHRVNAVRIRIWNEPFDENGQAYLGGTCDLNNLLWLAKKVKQKGMDIFLCLHYSDFWADPGKQFIPKAWQSLSYEQLLLKVYSFTKDVLLNMKRIGCSPSLVQIGNEITNGMLWPFGKLESADGKRGNYDRFCDLVKMGVKAVKELEPKAKIVLHLENSCNNSLYHEWLDNVILREVDFDILGVSYYSNWHGQFKDLENNLAELKKHYGKEVMIAETSYAFCFDKHQYSDSTDNSLVVNKALLQDEKVIFPFEVSKKGQKAFMESLFDLCEKLKLCGIFFWEAGWIPTPNGSWASKSAREYLDEQDKNGGNEWCNQCLFDYKGKALPALSVFDRQINSK